MGEGGQQGVQSGRGGGPGDFPPRIPGRRLGRASCRVAVVTMGVSHHATRARGSRAAGRARAHLDLAGAVADGPARALHVGALPHLLAEHCTAGLEPVADLAGGRPRGAAARVGGGAAPGGGSARGRGAARGAAARVGGGRRGAPHERIAQLQQRWRRAGCGCERRRAQWRTAPVLAGCWLLGSPHARAAPGSAGGPDGQSAGPAQRGRGLPAAPAPLRPAPRPVCARTASAAAPGGACCRHHCSCWRGSSGRGGGRGAGARQATHPAGMRLRREREPHGLVQQHHVLRQIEAILARELHVAAGGAAGGAACGTWAVRRARGRCSGEAAAGGTARGPGRARSASRAHLLGLRARAEQRRRLQGLQGARDAAYEVLAWPPRALLRATEGASILVAGPRAQGGRSARVRWPRRGEWRPTVWR
jgi:hypothetical protein